MAGELKRAIDRLMDGVRADWALYVKYTGAVKRSPSMPMP